MKIKLSDQAVRRIAKQFKSGGSWDGLSVKEVDDQFWDYSYKRYYYETLDQILLDLQDCVSVISVPELEEYNDGMNQAIQIIEKMKSILERITLEAYSNFD